MLPITRLTTSIPPLWHGNEYSSVRCCNSDCSKILIIAVDHFICLAGDGTFLKDLPIGASQQPRWSRKDPSIFYFVLGSQLRQMNVVTGSQAIVHTFDEYTAITGKGESDLSADGDHMVFAGDDRDVFVFTLSTGLKGPVYPQTEAFDGLKITPDNHILLSRARDPHSEVDGIYLVDEGMRRLTSYDEHAAVGRGTDGSEILVWVRADTWNGIEKIRIADGQTTPLLQLDWSLASNVSLTDSGLACVSTYATSSTGAAYTDQILLVALDGAGVEAVVCDHGSKPFNEYNWQPKASISPDGSRIVFSSNMGQYPGTEYIDAYMVELARPLPVPVSVLTEINYVPLEGRKWRQELELEVIGGKMVVTSFREFDRG